MWTVSSYRVRQTESILIKQLAKSFVATFHIIRICKKKMKNTQEMLSACDDTGNS